MITVHCHHCSAKINVDAATRGALKKSLQFQCPSCSGFLPTSLLKTASLSDTHSSNRNLLILGMAVLIVLGGLGFILASKKSGDTNTTVQNIRNEVINNSYFKNLIATGTTTKQELEGIEDIRSYQDGFIGISAAKLDWKEANAMATRTGGVVVDVSSDDELESWLTKTFPSNSLAWVLTRGGIGLMTNSGAIALKATNGQHQVLLHWNSSRPKTEIGKFDQVIVNQGADKMVAGEKLPAVVGANGEDMLVAPAPDGFAHIPAGNFTMGKILVKATTDLPLPRNVYVSEFYMAKHEVTLGLWNKVCDWGGGNGYTGIRGRADNDNRGRADNKVNHPNHPVYYVSWWNAVQWCNARSEMEGLIPAYSNDGKVMRMGKTVPEVNWNANGYRLPTEAEWEKAARGGVTGQLFPWGDEINHSHANYYAGSLETYETAPYSAGNHHPTYHMGTKWVGGTPPPIGDFLKNLQEGAAPVGSFAPNGYGLYDMAGNVSEWCWDWWSPDIFEGARDPRGPDAGSYRAIRSSTFTSMAAYCCCDFRSRSEPDHYTRGVGFRLARSSDR